MELRQPERNLTGGKILKFKSKYVGDNSNTVGLIDALGMPKGVSRGDIELQTKKQPYGIIINCKLEKDSELVKDGVLDDNPFYRNAVIMFSLIDNADTVEVKLEDGAVESFVYTRKMAQQSFNGADVRSFAKNQADFEAFLKKVLVIVRPAENPPQSGTADSQDGVLSANRQPFLPKVSYWDKTDSDMDFLYTAADEKYGSKEENTFTISGVILYGSETEGNRTEYFATIGLTDYQMQGDTLMVTGGASLPVAITGVKDAGGKMVCTDVVQAQDGSYFAPSIRKFCGSHGDVAEKMISRYGKEDFQSILKKNLQTYLVAAKLSPTYYNNMVDTIRFDEYLSK
jgi:hypothetical protein